MSYTNYNLSDVISMITNLSDLSLATDVIDARKHASVTSRLTAIAMKYPANGNFILNGMDKNITIDDLSYIDVMALANALNLCKSDYAISVKYDLLKQSYSKENGLKREEGLTMTMDKDGAMILTVKGTSFYASSIIGKDGETLGLSAKRVADASKNTDATNDLYKGLNNVTRKYLRALGVHTWDYSSKIADFNRVMKTRLCNKVFKYYKDLESEHIA